ncbi:hypothetical protein COW91_01875, partial [Candidatus Nomurabacteria bacterium CG22_combo_CG10-13_8_21_14_all_32_8]
MLNNLLCPWDAPTWFFFSENVPNLLLYSHLTAILSSFTVGLIIFLKNKKQTEAKLMSILFILFSLWIVIDLILWATNRTDVVMFFWSIQILVEPLIFVIAFFLFNSYSKGRQPKFWFNLLMVIILIPFIIFIPTNLTLTGINTYDCVASEGTWSIYYSYFIEILSILGIFFIAIRKIISIDNGRERAKVIYFGLGLLAFLIAFSSGNIIGSITGDWDLAQYGLFGMPIFVGFLTYLIVEYKIYNLNILGAQALITTLWFLIGSLLFVAQSIQTRVVSGFTLLVAVILGIILIRSIKNTVHQREAIEKLAIKLEKANVRLKILDKQKSEFVSIASHQLRSPLTSIRGYISMMQEGSFGAVTAKMVDPLQRINDSTAMMATSIEDFLSVSRIEAGNMKYEYSDFNLRDQAEHIVDDL